MLYLYDVHEYISRESLGTICFRCEPIGSSLYVLGYDVVFYFDIKIVFDLTKNVKIYVFTWNAVVIERFLLKGLTSTSTSMNIKVKIFTRPLPDMLNGVGNTYKC